MLILLAIVPYWQTLNHDFVNFDDPSYVSENPIVHQGLTWNNIQWAFTTMQAGNWHPLTWLSHMMDCQMYGLQPGWHHLTNLLIHGANTALLFMALRAMTGAMWRSALVAAFFAVHPVHVESVAWIAERKDVLSTFFGLCALWAYAKYARETSALRYGVVACFFVLSLLTKPMLVTLPFVLLLLDFWPLNRFSTGGGDGSSRFASLLLEKLPLIAISAVSSVVTFIAQHAAGAVAPIELLPLQQRLANTILAYASYLGKTVWPVNLAVIYPLPNKIMIVPLLIATVALIAITVVVWIYGRERRWLIMGWLWYLGTLVPVIGLVQVGDQSMADRYTYFPLIGVFIMLIWSIPAAAFASGTNRRLLSAGVALILLTLIALTWLHLRVWQNTNTLFDYALKVTTRNFVAENLYAGALGSDGDMAGAKAHIERALELKPDYAGAHYNLGLVLLREHNFEKAREQFTTALQTLPRDPMIWNGLGVANINLGKPDEAISNYRKALELNPLYADAFTDLGAAYLSTGKFAESVEASEKALRYRPEVAETHATLGAALWNLGRSDESIMNNRKAVELNPNLVSARVNLGLALLSKGRYDEAIANAEVALRIDPQNELAQRVLASARGKRDEGINQPQ